MNSNSDVVDVGANIGLYTVLFSKIISKQNKVLAIEPANAVLKYLYNNIKMNNCEDSVIIFEGAASETEASAFLNTIPGKEEYSSIGDLVNPDVENLDRNLIKIKTNTIDQLVSSYQLNPGFIKIDIEGAELLALNGLIKTITTYHPIILFELSSLMIQGFGYSIHDVLVFFKLNNYILINITAPNKPIKKNFRGEILAIPN